MIMRSYLFSFMENLVVSCKTWNHPQTSQILDKPPVNQPIQFLLDFYLNLTDILMVCTQNYKKNHLISYSKKLSVAFSEIFEDFDIFWWRQQKLDDVSNFFLTTFQVKHPIGGGFCQSNHPAKIGLKVSICFYRIHCLVIFHNE